MSAVEAVRPAVAAAEPEEAPTVFDFDEAFQSKVAALTLRDNRFLRMAAHLLKPEYFENVGEAAMVKLGLDFYEKYNTAMTDPAIAVEQFKEAIRTKVIRSSEVGMVKDSLKLLYGKSIDLSGAEFVAEKAAEFARNQAMQAALLASVDLLGRRDMEKINALIKDAMAVAIKSEEDGYDYFEKIETRTEERLDKASGKTPPRGITTGHRELDEVLYHKGWGRKELSAILGGAKAGKTTALINFGKAASLAGSNVLYCTLEVGAGIVSDRLDASMSDTLIKALGSHILDVKSKIQEIRKKAGLFKIHEYAAGTMRPAHLEALLERYEAAGVKFDLVIVDYADIMAPNHRHQDPIENSRTIYIDLRAIAFKFDCAVLTATQTNRDGFKATTAKAEHVAEDFNKVRTIDIMISISASEEERARGEARLFFAASRNSETGFALRIQQDISKMQFIKKIIGRE